MTEERFTGRVKWFNNKAGYGFITVTDGSKSGTDVFVHHSSIKVDSEQYRYLVQGEYVEFTLSSAESGEHEFHAGDVCGIKGGKLMCETRHDSRVARNQYREQQPREQQSREQQPREQRPREQQQVDRKPKSVSAPRRETSQRQQDANQSSGDWKQVNKGGNRKQTTGKRTNNRKTTQQTQTNA